MSQKLKEYYFPEDYGVPCNVDMNTKMKIGNIILHINSIKTICDINSIKTQLDILIGNVEKLYYDETKTKLTIGSSDDS